MKLKAVAFVLVLVSWIASPVRAGQVELVSRVAPDQISDTANGAGAPPSFRSG